MSLIFNSYSAALMQYITCSNEIILTLKCIRQKVQKHQTGVLGAQTAATVLGVASTASSVGVAFAPVTGGISIIIPLVTFIVTGSSSLIVAAGAGIGDYVVSKKLGKKLRAQQEKHLECVNNLNLEHEKIQHIREFLQNEGYSAEVATLITLLLNVEDLKISIQLTPKTRIGVILAAARLADAFKLSDGFTLLDKSVRLGISLAKTFNPAAGSFGLKVAEEMVAFASISAGQGKNLVKVSPSIGFLVKRLPVVGIVLTAVDIALLIKNWNSTHEHIEFIDEFVAKLENDCMIYQKQINEVNSLITS